MHGKRRGKLLTYPAYLSVETVDQDYQNNYTIKGIWTQEMRTDWVAMMDHQTTTPQQCHRAFNCVSNES